MARSTMRIVVLDGYTLNPGDNPWTSVEQLGETVVYDRTPEDQIVSRSKAADVLVVNKVPLTGSRLQELPDLKYVTVTATGFDCVDTAVASERGIPVSNVPVYGTDSVAQYVFAALLTLCHRLDLHDAAVRDGEWVRCGDFSFWKMPLTELVGKTMGIVGFGRIGRRVGQLANAFGMRVLAYDTAQNDNPSYQPFAWSGLTELVSNSDVISLHCPSTPDTIGMVNSQLLQHCKTTAILINASRGALVVESDLTQALNDDQLAAAALDVVSVEPIQANNPLLSAKNCLLTPHMAWATLEARRRLMETTASNVAGFLAGKPTNVVN